MKQWLRFNLMYLRRPPWDTGIAPPELEAFLRANPPGRALDLGCGTGTNLLALGKAGWQVRGVDFALRAVRDARRRLANAGIAGEAQVGDVTRLEDARGPDPAARYQLVLDIGCYHGLPEAGRAAYRRNLPELLAPGGVFLLYAHLRPVGSAEGLGLGSADLDALGSALALANRQDSFDRWGRQAAWLTYRAAGPPA